MSGQPITDARLALRRFVQSARPADSIALISFSDSISLDQNLGTDRNRILSRIDRLQPGGGTHLYDAVAAGVRMLAGIEGQKVVVYLTDGNDNGSILSARELHQMNIGENVFVYGVGRSWRCRSSGNQGIVGGNQRRISCREFVPRPREPL